MMKARRPSLSPRPECGRSCFRSRLLLGTCSCAIRARCRFAHSCCRVLLAQARSSWSDGLVNGRYPVFYPSACTWRVRRQRVPCRPSNGKGADRQRCSTARTVSAQAPRAPARLKCCLHVGTSVCIPRLRNDRPSRGSRISDYRGTSRPGTRPDPRRGHPGDPKTDRRRAGDHRLIKVHVNVCWHMRGSPH